jgi:hypothetical protein
MELLIQTKQGERQIPILSVKSEDERDVLLLMKPTLEHEFQKPNGKKEAHVYH